MERIVLPDGVMLLMPACGGDLRLSEMEPGDVELLDALDGSLEMGELEGRFGARRVGETVGTLAALGLIDDAREDERLPFESRERFERQLRYLGEVGAPDGPTPVECQERLAAARVAVIGTGGLGGRVAIDLASVGVGELRLADGDVVERSNLARQIQYDEADIDRPKVERLAARIAALNSSTAVESEQRMLIGEEEIASFARGADLVVDAADQPPHEIERRVNAACFGLAVPYLAMSHFPPIARIGPLYVPGETGCYACQEAGFRRQYPLYDLAARQRSRRPIPSATLGPACGLTAGWVAGEAMHLLTGVTRPATLGAALVLDLRTGELRREEVVPEPGCPICGGSVAKIPKDHEEGEVAAG